MTASSLPKLHAVLVGINKYSDPQLSNLQSAVGDANKFEEFFKIHWDPSKCFPLRDEEATQSAIIEQLSLLQSDSDVSRNDAIVFFFSGYAGNATAEGKEGAKEVGIICPTDFTDKGGGISDQTLVKLFDQISKACGNNITVFLDCPSSLFTWGDPSSFVVVAPEEANDTENGGAFTHSVLKILKDELKDLDLLTIQSLADKIQADTGTTINCYGQNSDRLAFKSSGGAFHTFISCQPVGEDIILNAGAAHGVAPGAIYAIYSSNVKSDRNKTHGLAKVICLNGDFKAKLHFCEGQGRNFKLPVFYAAQIHHPDQTVKIHVSPPTEVAESSPGSNKSEDIFFPFSKKVDDPKTADIILKFQGDDVNYSWNGVEADDGRVGETKMSCIPTSKKDIKEVLEMAARFNYLLSRPSPEQSAIPLDLFEVDFHKVTVASEGLENKHTPGELIAKTGERFVDLEIGKSHSVCITLRNKTTLPVWPHVFLFDPLNLGIYLWYSAKVPIPANENEKPLPVGCGDEGNLYFWGHVTRVVYLVVFVTTERTTFSSLNQGYDYSDPSNKDFLDDEDASEKLRDVLTATSNDSLLSDVRDTNVPYRRNTSLVLRAPAQWSSKCIAIIHK